MSSTRLLATQHGIRGRTPPAVSRQRARTEATRKKLLAAAEKTFARDGFEAARLEDIASMAGYTRGAFYANFKSKEDIFFACSNNGWPGGSRKSPNCWRGRTLPPSAYAPCANITCNLRKIAGSCCCRWNSSCSRSGIRRRTRDCGRGRPLRACGGDLVRRIAHEVGRDLPISSTSAATGLGALSNALLLEHLVDNAIVTDQDIRFLLGAFSTLSWARTPIASPKDAPGICRPRCSAFPPANPKNGRSFHSSCEFEFYGTVDHNGRFR